MREPLPLATIHDAVLEFLRGRDDAVVFGAQAVNAYVGEPRMSQDIDLISTRATELAEELREYLTASLSKPKPGSLSGQITFCFGKGCFFDVNSFGHDLLNPVFNAGFSVKTREECGARSNLGGKRNGLAL